LENVMRSLKRWSVSVEEPAPLVNSHVQASAPAQPTPARSPRSVIDWPSG
jgi:hypothetical protein